MSSQIDRAVRQALNLSGTYIFLRASAAFWSACRPRGLWATQPSGRNIKGSCQRAYRRKLAADMAGTTHASQSQRASSQLQRPHERPLADGSKSATPSRQRAPPMVGELPTNYEYCTPRCVHSRGDAPTTHNRHRKTLIHNLVDRLVGCTREGEGRPGLVPHVDLFLLCGAVQRCAAYGFSCWSGTSPSAPADSEWPGRAAAARSGGM